jgi:hypothetical protein
VFVEKGDSVSVLFFNKRFDKRGDPNRTASGCGKLPFGGAPPV